MPCHTIPHQTMPCRATHCYTVGIHRIHLHTTKRLKRRKFWEDQTHGRMYTGERVGINDIRVRGEGERGEGRERERERDILSFGTSNKNAPEPKTLDPPRCNVYPTGRLSPPTVFSTAGASRSRTSLLKSSRYFSVLGHQRTHLYGV